MRRTQLHLTCHVRLQLYVFELWKETKAQIIRAAQLHKQNTNFIIGKCMWVLVFGFSSFFFFLSYFCVSQSCKHCIVLSGVYAFIFTQFFIVFCVLMRCICVSVWVSIYFVLLLLLMLLLLLHIGFWVDGIITPYIEQHKKHTIRVCILQF